MGNEVRPRNTTPGENELSRPIRGHGVGGALILVGFGLIYSEFPKGAPAVGAGLGLLLLLVGWDLIIPAQPDDRSAR
jgi:hypothetical protein